MAYSQAWVETNPLGSTQASDIDLLFRDFKRDLRERLNTAFVDFTTDPVRPKHLMLASFNTDVGTGAVATEVTLRTITVPANTLGINGILRITFGFIGAGTNGSKTLRVKFGGTDIAARFPQASAVVWAAADETEGFCEIIIANRAATNSQVVHGHIGGTAAGTGGTQRTLDQITLAKDTTANQDIVITGQTGDASDEITLAFVMVEALRAA
jgi:hypothetical protein